jgi:Domain of unknown function (DUF6817)
MPCSFQQLVDYFHTLATEDVSHTDGTYMGHCFSVYRDMKKWGFDEDLARAGLFHSIYGTGLFQRFKLGVEKRQEVRDLIGERAERLAYLNCSIVYDEFDEELARQGETFRMTGRLTGELIELGQEELNDLLRVHLVDRLEQIPRSKAWEWRKEAFREIANRLGPQAQAEFDRVYALEAAG